MKQNFSFNIYEQVTFFPRFTCHVHLLWWVTFKNDLIWDKKLQLIVKNFIIFFNISARCTWFIFDWYSYKYILLSDASSNFIHTSSTPNLPKILNAQSPGNIKSITYLVYATMARWMGKRDQISIKFTERYNALKLVKIN